jgi:hypothetical protein
VSSLVEEQQEPINTITKKTINQSPTTTLIYSFFKVGVHINIVL